MGLKFDMDAHEVQDLKVFNSEGEVIYQADRAAIEIHQKLVVCGTTESNCRM